DAELAEEVLLGQKQVRKYCGELEGDGLILKEEMNDKVLKGPGKVEYWYIDFKHFYNVVRYRLFVMDKQLREDEQREIERQTFRCSNDDCGREYTALEAQLLLTPDVYEFHCGHCNSKLVECDNNETLEKIKTRLSKFRSQMNQADGLHDGIYECLARISEFLSSGQVLPSNMPSERRAAAVAATAKATARGGGGGGSRGSNDKSSALFGKYEALHIQIRQLMLDDYSTLNSNKPKDEIKLQPATTASSLPEFLVNNKISSKMLANQKTKGAIPDTTTASIANASTLGITIKSEVDQEAYRADYLRELERYNQMDKSKEDEEFEDMEWEWCDMGPQEMYDESLRSVMVPVRGCPIPIVKLTEDDLLTMTPDEYTSFYQLCRSMMT
ncbi:hypothetical protein THRCLA_11035, partial [Thraustotheca clavata]